MNNFTIRDVFKNAWSRLHGAKSTIWSIAILVLLIAATIEYFSKWLFMTDSQALHYWARYIIIPIIMNLLIGPFYGGSLMVAIKRSRNEAINIKSGYQYTHRYLQAGVVMAIIGFISNLVVMITNIPSIALHIGRFLPYFDLVGALFSLAVYTLFLLSIPLTMDKNKGIFAALIESSKRVKSHWLRIFFIFFLAYLMLFIFYLPIVIGLALNSGLTIVIGIIIFIFVMIWFFPFLFLLGGDIYHRLVDLPEYPH